ncbi:hypothetical protein ACFL54_06610 [Planctomycetota bacterium]
MVSCADTVKTGKTKVQAMEYDILDEPIKVRLDMSPGKIRPLKFKRNGQIFKIKKLNSTWIDTSGRDKVYYFSVEAEGDIYQLKWLKEDCTWWLHAVLLE